MAKIEMPRTETTPSKTRDNQARNRQRLQPAPLSGRKEYHEIPPKKEPEPQKKEWLWKPERRTALENPPQQESGLSQDARQHLEQTEIDAMGQIEAAKAIKKLMLDQIRGGGFTENSFLYHRKNLVQIRNYLIGIQSYLQHSFEGLAAKALKEKVYQGQVLIEDLITSGEQSLYDQEIQRRREAYDVSQSLKTHPARLPTQPQSPQERNQREELAAMAAKWKSPTEKKPKGFFQTLKSFFTKKR